MVLTFEAISIERASAQVDTVCRRKRQEVASALPSLGQKAKGTGCCHPMPPGSYPPPGTLPNYYCSTGYAAPVQAAEPPLCGVAPAEPALKWSTPSSDEQKLRTPVWLKAAGAAPTP